jgi:hypothetical protein
LQEWVSYSLRHPLEKINYTVKFRLKTDEGFHETDRIDFRRKYRNDCCSEETVYKMMMRKEAKYCTKWWIANKAADDNIASTYAMKTIVLND